MSCIYGIEQSCGECRMCQNKKEEEKPSTKTVKERKDDLISRKALISHIENEYRQWGEDYDVEQILGDIEDFSTAYDVDKVAEQLEQKGNNIFASHFPEDEQEFMDNGIAKGFWQSAEIVKAGGVNEKV